MVLSIIVAVANNNVIGKNNQLIWHMSADLVYFKKLTMGHPIIMGRKTYESIGKPLPGRTSVIITQNKQFVAPGCITVHSLEEALSCVKDYENAFIIGGAQIYEQALAKADKLYLTRIYEDFDGDTFFPEIKDTEWLLMEKTDFNLDEKNPYPYSFLIYNKIKS